MCTSNLSSGGIKCSAPYPTNNLRLWRQVYGSTAGGIIQTTQELKKTRNFQQLNNTRPSPCGWRAAVSCLTAHGTSNRTSCEVTFHCFVWVQRASSRIMTPHNVSSETQIPSLIAHIHSSHVLTDRPTNLWSRVLLEKLRVTQLVKKFPAFYENPKVYYRVHKSQPLISTLSQMHPIHIFRPILSSALQIENTAMARIRTRHLLDANQVA